MSKLGFAEQHMAILSPAEGVIVSFYKQNFINHDYDVIRVYEALVAHYRAITTNFPLPEPKLSQHKLTLYTAILKQWQEEEPKTLLECVKLLKKSALLWNRNHGAQGYLQYISRFF
jgi:hypothetical protein